MGLPRSNRMTRRGEFQRVKEEGHSFIGRHLILGVLQDREIGFFQVGFVLPKHLGNAVKRNLIKRRLCHIIRLYREAIQPHHYIVTIGRKGCTQLKFEELKNEWVQLAEKGRIHQHPKQP